jgi:hypothetical protein
MLSLGEPALPAEAQQYDAAPLRPSCLCADHPPPEA